MEFKKREIKKPETPEVTPDLNAVENAKSTQSIVVQVRSELFEYRQLQTLALAFGHTYSSTNYQQAGRFALFVYSLEEIGDPGKVVQFWNNALRSINKKAYYSMHNGVMNTPSVSDTDDDPVKKTGGCQSCAEKARARAAALKAAEEQAKAEKAENESV